MRRYTIHQVRIDSLRYLHLLWLERSYHATSFPGSSPTRVKKGPWERGCLPRVLLCQTRLYSLTVTWGMCSFVITCFITSIGHGEPPMTPDNEELPLNFPINMTLLSITTRLKIFQPTQYRQNVQNTTIQRQDANFPRLPSVLFGLCSGVCLGFKGQSTRTTTQQTMKYSGFHFECWKVIGFV